MKILTASIILLSSIWTPAILEQYYPIEGWISIPINLSFFTIYVLTFLTLLLTFTKNNKIQRINNK